MKHTPGPWVAERTEVYVAGNLPQPMLFTIPNKMETAFAPGEAEANAHLIAAAPEMLEALNWALHHIEETHGLKDDELSVIRHAISKATGGAE